MHINLNFPGEPKAVQSVRFARIGDFMRKYQPKEVTEWKNWIRIQARQQLPQEFSLISDVGISLRVSFEFTAPKSWSKKKIAYLQSGAIIHKTTRPDLGDNLLKGLNDALTGIVWQDDGQICEIRSRKVYGLAPQITMQISTVLETEIQPTLFKL